VRERDTATLPPPFARSAALPQPTAAVSSDPGEPSVATLPAARSPGPGTGAPPEPLGARHSRRARISSHLRPPGHQARVDSLLRPGSFRSARRFWTDPPHPVLDSLELRHSRYRVARSLARIC
jgi:hypothetical protein